MFFPFLWHNFNSQGKQVLKALTWVLTQEREFIGSSSGREIWPVSSTFHVKKSLEYPESESSGLLENKNSFSFFVGPLAKSIHASCCPSIVRLLDFFGREMSVSGSSRAEVTVDWEHPSVELLPPTEMQMNSRRFVHCVCFLKH